MSLAVVAVVVLCVAVCLAIAAQAMVRATVEVTRTYLIATERKTAHSPVAELETRMDKLENRLRTIEMRGMTR